MIRPDSIRPDSIRPDSIHPDPLREPPPANTWVPRRARRIRSSPRAVGKVSPDPRAEASRREARASRVLRPFEPHASTPNAFRDGRLAGTAASARRALAVAAMTSSANACVSTARNGVAPETRSVVPSGRRSADSREEDDGAPSYVASTDHGSSAGSHAATLGLKCAMSTTAVHSATTLGDARASTETRRSDTRASGAASASASTNTVASTIASNRAVATMPNRPLGSRAAGDGRACRAGARAARGGAIGFPPSSPTAKNTPSRVKSWSLARGRYTARGARPSLNPAPAEVRAGPSANAVGGSASVRSNRRHTTASMGGGACDALATWPHATYPGGGTGRQKLAVPPFYASRATRNRATRVRIPRAPRRVEGRRPRRRRVERGGWTPGVRARERRRRPGNTIPGGISVATRSGAVAPEL